MKQKTVVLTGAGGQLGETIKADWQAVADDSSIRLLCFDQAQLDITDPGQIEEALSSYTVDALINAAAYTNVDKAEQEQDLAYRVNRDGAGLLARWCKQHQCRLLHISTDFVFDGNSSTAYQPQDNTAPLNTYGASKLAGEQAVLDNHPAGAIIIRTSWLYSRYRGNFVKTMLRLMSEKDRLQVVADQLGTPTSTHGLAALIGAVIGSTVSKGVFHWSDAGVASWYDFAVAIQEEAHFAGLLEQAIPIEPVNSDQYPTPAARPAFSLLDKSTSYASFACEPVHWRRQLRQVINELAQANQPIKEVL